MIFFLFNLMRNYFLYVNMIKQAEEVMLYVSCAGMNSAILDRK